MNPNNQYQPPQTPQDPQNIPNRPFIPKPPMQAPSQPPAQPQTVFSPQQQPIAAPEPIVPTPASVYQTPVAAAPIAPPKKPFIKTKSGLAIIILVILLIFSIVTIVVISSSASKKQASLDEQANKQVDTSATAPATSESINEINSYIGQQMSELNDNTDFSEESISDKALQL
ncbi:hypothetical protein KBC85_03610 [Candidatus Saccharibacteria bacterium]|nr:hypothetical protein [Candidatus Saccharibacteria bacterium]MDQ5953526.1 hypothetical protein [Patescibacteria group bacterium]MDQ5958698.1 hypothetical protein [Patescibacteria group bacterium]